MAEVPSTPFPINFSDPKVKVGVIAAILTGLVVVALVIGFVVFTVAYNFNLLNWLE
jgi:hypothetical protein